jgi:hypothetical protein
MLARDGELDRIISGRGLTFERRPSGEPTAAGAVRTRSPFNAERLLVQRGLRHPVDRRRRADEVAL